MTFQPLHDSPVGIDVFGFEAGLHVEETHLETPTTTSLFVSAGHPGRRTLQALGANSRAFTRVLRIDSPLTHPQTIKSASATSNRASVDQHRRNWTNRDSTSIHLVANCRRTTLSNVIETLEEHDFAIVVVGLGGWTGTQFARLVCKYHQIFQKKVQLIASLPFHFEGQARRERSLDIVDQMEKLKQVTVIDADETLPSRRVSLEQAFLDLDKAMAEACIRVWHESKEAISSAKHCSQKQSLSAL